MTWLLQSSLLIFALAVVGGVVPLLLSQSERIQHLLIAFATGVFLGVVFLHLLPEMGEASSGVNGEPRPELWLFVLAGVVALFILENVAFHHRAQRLHGDHGPADHGHHKAVEYAALFGLSVHALTAGLALSTAVGAEELRSAMLLSVVSHKAVEGFSLAAVFLLAGASRRRAFGMIVLFGLVTPIGALAGAAILGEVGAEGGLGVLTALATGTFLFVALCDLLPEVFHHREDAWPKVALLAAGVGVGLFLHAHA